MEQNLNIRNEIQALSPALAAIGTKMPYSVPEGYFDTLPLELLLQTAPKNSMTVPENYFETLAVETLLKANATANAGSVPQGYFDNFADQMLAKVKALDAEEQEEDVELSPILKSIGKKTPYTVPEGYFDQITIPNFTPAVQDTKEESTPVVQIKSRRNIFTWVAAACTVGVISLLTWQFAFKNNSNKPDVGSLANNQNIEFTDTSLATEELAAALALIEINSLQKAIDFDDQSAVYYLNTDNFESAVQGLTDEELEEYLLETGSISES